MKTKYTLQELKDKSIIINCPTKTMADKVCNTLEFLLETMPESTPEPIPTEYAVLTNATESAKKQIAEFEQVLAQIKIDAMKLGTRDLARLIKALKAI